MKHRISVVLLLCFTQHAYGADASAESRYAELCASCHTTDIAAGFQSAPIVGQGSDEEIARVIREGRPQRGMPAFGRVLSETDVQSLIVLLRGRVQAGGPRPGGNMVGGSMVGRTIEAEALRPDRSAGYGIAQMGTMRFVANVDRGSHLCYDDIDLSGVRSIEYRYAKGDGEPPRRFALLAYGGKEFDTGNRVHLGEKITRLTGGWETYRTDRIGFARQLQGRYRLCFIGMEGGGVFNLDKFTLSDRPAANDGVTEAFDVSHDVIVAAGHSFRLEKVAEVDGELWSMDFLGDDTFICTQKSGELWLFRNARRIGQVAGTPKVLFLGQAGLFTVLAHPDHASNGWVYMTFADPAANGSMTKIVRGRIRGLQWVDEQVIYEAPSEQYSDSQAHYGARLAFDGHYLFFSVGDRGEQNNAQDLSNPFGKIHRIFPDGRIPEDNPFTAKPTALASIWSYGHRNPQGLTAHPATHAIWASEHGPKGGDELNRILKGRNYGWPLATFGINYDGTTISDATHRDGLEPPRAHWSPSIGVSAVRFYTAQRFPKWRNQLLVASLARQELRLVRIDSSDVVTQEVLIQGMGRIRDVVVAADGYPYIVLNHPNGMIYRLVPANRG